MPRTPPRPSPVLTSGHSGELSGHAFSADSALKTKRSLVHGNSGRARFHREALQDLATAFVMESFQNKVFQIHLVSLLRSFVRTGSGVLSLLQPST